MKLLLAAFTAALTISLPVQAAKEVFVHVIVGNTPDFDHSDWDNDIRLAQESKIDGFVLNIAAQDPDTNARALNFAFQVANNRGFKLFFSFDYAAQGPWPQDQVRDLITTFAVEPSYFKPDGTRPLVSTFEGPANANDWPAIKQNTSAFFIPDWSSHAPQDAASLAGGVVDGLFSFSAWPNGDTNITTDADREFQRVLQPQGKAYMMPVSPWFFTNLPGYNKNWLWRGDGLWDLRWSQVMQVQPDYVEILTWNDIGESHNIRTAKEKEMGLFTSANAPINYARGMSHDGWRKFLPFYIDMYKTGQVPADFAEGVVATYRTAPALACPSGGTSGNDAGHGQTEVPPETLVEDAVFYSVLLKTDQDVTVTVSIGGKEQTGVLSGAPPAGAGTPGVYTGSVPFGGNTGDVVVKVVRGGQEVATAKGGKPISTQCENNVQNWNAVSV